MPKQALNVIVICCDTLRADVVDHTWEDKVDLPNIDRLRSESANFTAAYGEAFPTVPMRRGFYTGRRAYPWKHDLDDRGSFPNLLGWHAIPHEYTTLAETLAESGVMTGLVADLYHIFKSTMNFTRGFLSYDYIRGQENDRVRSGPLSAIDIQKHLHPDETNPAPYRGLVQYLLNTLDRQSEEDYFAPKVFRSAARWIDDNIGQKPFYLHIESFTPHEFWDPPKHFADRYCKPENRPDLTYPQYFQKNFKFNDYDIRRTKALYYGYCTFVDKWIGHLLAKLDDHKLWDDTVVIFTSDHGTELWEKGQFGKSGSRLHPYNTRLNLAIRHPDRKYRGKTCDALVQNIDLAPTVCNFTGIESTEPYDGQDLMLLLDGKKKNFRDHAIGAWEQHAFVRDHNYNFVIDTYNPERKTELYDIKSDPHERENIAAAKPKIVKEMQQKLEKLLGAPLPAKYAHKVRKQQLSTGIASTWEKWVSSNLGRE